MMGNWPVPVIFSILVLGSFPLNDAFALDPPPFDSMWGKGVDDGTTVFQICTSGCQTGVPGTLDGELENPFHAAVGPSGNVYVTDVGNDRVQKYTSDGTFILNWGGFNFPAGIAVNSAGDVYVVDQTFFIEKYTSTGTFILSWGGGGSGDGKFNFPEGMAFDSAGNVYVADVANDRVQKFTSTGTFISKISGSIPTAGVMNSPRGVAVDSDDNLYVTDTDNNRILKFDSTGTFLLQWGSGPSSTDGLFDVPRGIAVDSDDNVYVADSENDRIQVFDTSGAFLTKWGSLGTGEGEFDIALGIAVDSGNVYVADFTNDRIQKFAEPQVAVGGTILPIDTTVLLLDFDYSNFSKAFL